ncbi:SET and MYND domain-containing protein 4-like [Venturia canescens]|uniref:SET and MYND domain-containing protein 4-like n=1 Tax=Venturia canescens TaxID=32260 RepID=UPI001C9CF79B|nr:SET and MYND domain-containing protein 4-like [Venturia canescens]
MEAELIRLDRKLQDAGQVKISNDEFSSLRSDDERFSYALSLLEKYDMTPKIEIEEKSSKLSASYRKAGNDLFVSSSSKGKRNEIIEFYTKCIAYAEPNSSELSLGYGNRSALLYEARLYEHCLQDIERALALQYPQHLRPKLLSRKVHCLKALRKISSDEVNREIEEIQLSIEATNLDESTKNKYHNAAELLRQKNVYPAQRKLFDEAKHKPVTPSDNPELPGVSSALAVVYDQEFGRHIRAIRNIEPGEVLSIQQGYATILAPENFYTHCSNCLRQTWSSVPCQRCPSVVFCDEKCRDDAWKHHHAFECFVISALLKLEFNLLGLMSLRLAIQALKDSGSFATLKHKIESLELEKDPRTNGFTGTPAILDERDYSIVYTLATNTEQRSTPDLFGRCFNAVYLTYCLGRLTDFFGQKFTGDIKSMRENPWSIFVGGLITRHQQIIPSNVHTVTETKGLFGSERGATIQPFLSLFNHCCDCMVSRIHYGSSVALYAVYPIQAGEQVFDNYGSHYAMESLYTRKRKLQRQFFFECQCRPCREDWPVFTRIPSLQESHLNRQQLMKVQKVLKNFNKYVGFATDGNVEDKPYIVKDLTQMIKTLFDYVDLPCREINEITETLKRVYDLLSIRFQSLED